MNNTALWQIVLTAFVSLFVGALTGGFAGYNGWQRNRIDRELNKTTEQLNQANTSSTLLAEALSLVNSLREEVGRLHTENANLRDKFDSLSHRVEELELENARLYGQLGRATHGPQK